MTEHIHPKAQFDGTASAVVIEQLTIGDPDVVREGRRWTGGERGPLIEDVEQLVGADLTSYVTETMRIGALALSATGQAQESRALERMLREVGDKTADSTARAAEVTGRVVQDAAEAVSKAAGDAKKAIVEADALSRQEFTKAVAAAKVDLSSEVRRIFGGEHPELLERLTPLLERFGTELDAKVGASTADLLAKAARQFDPADPTSPMAKHAADLTARQARLTAQLDRNHTELAGKVEELVAALRVQEAKTTLAKVTPLKGSSYAARVHPLLHEIAGGLGDEYVDTSERAGRLPRCKKGDGVLTIDGGTARVVLEMTDSARTGWGEYLEDAERNRDAVAGLGVVRMPAQNGGQTVRVIAPRRLVLAFDPGTDDPDLLRTTVLLLRTMALAASSRHEGHEIAVAEEKIGEAVAQLDRIDSVRKLARAIEKNAGKVDSQCAGLSTTIRRLLDEALVALSGATSGGTEAVDAERGRSGAA